MHRVQWNVLMMEDLITVRSDIFVVVRTEKGSSLENLQRISIQTRTRMNALSSTSTSRHRDSRGRSGGGPMDEPQSSQDGIPKSKFTYRHLNALSCSTPPRDNPLR